MLLIAHRGNIYGPNKNENNPDYLISTIKLDFDVECDLWSIKDKLYLGHDEPQYLINNNFIFNNQAYLWLHLKNVEALVWASNQENLNYFWHGNDDYTITSKGFIWVYPGKYCPPGSIQVQNSGDKLQPEIYGLCSDFVGLLNLNKRIFNEQFPELNSGTS